MACSSLPQLLLDKGALLDRGVLASVALLDELAQEKQRYAIFMSYMDVKRKRENYAYWIT